MQLSCLAQHYIHHNTVNLIWVIIIANPRNFLHRFASFLNGSEHPMVAMRIRFLLFMKVAYCIICRAGNSLIRSLLICSFSHFAQFKWATVSDLLRFLKTNEWPWVNRSGCSEEMSDCEQIAEVAQDKWATVSHPLRSLRGNMRMSDSLKKCWLKKSKILCLVCFIYDF